MKFTLALCALALAAPTLAQAQNTIPVTADNFNRAETDMRMTQSSVSQPKPTFSAAVPLSTETR